MRVATMSRKTKRAYLRLCAEKRQKELHIKDDIYIYQFPTYFYSIIFRRRAIV